VRDTESAFSVGRHQSVRAGSHNSVRGQQGTFSGLGLSLLWEKARSTDCQCWKPDFFGQRLHTLSGLEVGFLGWRQQGSIRAGSRTSLGAWNHNLLRLGVEKQLKICGRKEMKWRLMFLLSLLCPRQKHSDNKFLA
jgi:hypothetical protein